MKQAAALALAGLVAAGLPACSSSADSPNSPTISAPVALFTYSPAGPTIGQTVQFTDASTHSPTSWSWAFGDGSTSSSQSPSHAYGSAGTFIVTLEVSNSAGSDTRSRAVTCNSGTNAIEALIPAGEFEMGDHFGFVDPAHPSDELPIHTVRISAFYMATATTTNQEFLAYLNDALAAGQIQVLDNIVYAAGTDTVYGYTHSYGSSYSIDYDGSMFAVVDFRAHHPVVGVMWLGAAAYCNWLSARNGLEACFDLATGACDFTKNGYRLPTEAEWEWAARGGQTNPYFNYVYGNSIDWTKANLPDSHDPYEGAGESTYPWTTPVRFFDGTLHLKSEFNWPGGATSYQTSNGANGFGLYDMQGNVWQFVYDWYAADYYSVSPIDNPHGPDAGSLMPDGLPYRNLRGGQWYNGTVIDGVNDGHSRVSNRDPSYYRGPLPQNQSWNGVGFRVARNDTSKEGAFHE